MRSDYKRLGDYIREVDVRNRDLKVTKLLGVSITKEFIPSIANTIGTDMSSYKIVNKGQFAYGPVTSRNGDKVSIALLHVDKAIISQAYTVFEIEDTNRLLPAYLMMWFRRPEFDRYARFKSHGSAREIFDWNEMCDVMLPVPSIDCQREIVKHYETLSERIRINESMISRLEATAQTLYRHLFVDNIDPENLPSGWRMGTIGEYATLKSGYAFKSSSWKTEGIPVIKIGNISDNTIDAKTCDCVESEWKKIAANYAAHKGDIVLAMTGATLGKIAIVPHRGFLINQRVGIFDLGTEPMNKTPFLYYLLLQDYVQNEIQTVGGDSAQANVSNKDIEKIRILIPMQDVIDEFNKKAGIILKNICIFRNEIKTLRDLQMLQLTQLTK